MATELQMILIIAITIFGGIISAVLGWADSGDPWDARKFITSTVRSAIGAGLLAFGFQGVTDVTIWVYLSAFMTGAGFDVIGKRLQEVVQKPPTPALTPAPVSQTTTQTTDNPPTPSTPTQTTDKPTA